jgi:hypothetical protein
MNEKDWGAIAQAMAAFANTDGGLFVFGVHANSQGKNFPDQVQSILPLTNVLSFKGAIQRRIHGLTEPPIPGIRVEHLDQPDAPGVGIVLLYVPRSDAHTHRTAEGPTGIRHQYFMRSDVSTVIMPHTLLAERFGRRPMAQLYLVVQYSLSRHHCSADVRICNRGRGYAERPAVRFIQDPDPQHPETNPDFWWHLFKPAKGWNNVVIPAGDEEGVGCVVRADAETVLYPGMKLPLGFMEDDGRQGPRTTFRLSIHGILYALNSPPARFSLVQELLIDPDEVLRTVGRVEIPSISSEEML